MPASNKKIIFALFVLLLTNVSLRAQHILPLDTAKAPDNYENIYVKKINSDSLVSSFLIWVKNEVKLHLHEKHSEIVYIIDGKGLMIIGEENKKVKKGDYIYIPQNTKHSVKVTSDTPLKVLSVQAPFFDGSDRVFIE